MATIIVGAGGFATIQEAINAAAEGDTIDIAAGTYAETLTIGKSLTFVGANSGIDGTGARGAETLITWSSGNAANVTTTGQVTFDGLKFEGAQVLRVNTAGGNVEFEHSVFSLTASPNNFYLSQPDHFTFANNLVDVTGYSGAVFQPVGDPEDPAGSTVTFTDNVFNGHAGADGGDNDVPVILNLSDVNGTVTGNSFDGVDIGVLVANGAGPLTISNNDFANMHRDPGDGLAAGVVFYEPKPFDGLITISGNSFEDMDAGIRSSGGLPATLEGSSISVDGNEFTNVGVTGSQSVGGVLHFTNSTVDGAGAPSLFFGGANGETFTNTGGSEGFSGGAGIDTVEYEAGHSIGFSDGHWTVSDNDTLDPTVDTLAGVEHVVIGDTTYLLVDPAQAGGFATIAEALAAAAGGETILLAPGEHAGGAVIDKSVTIQGLPGATIEGNFSDVNGFADTMGHPSEPVADWLKGVAAYTGAPVTSFGLTVTADGVTIRDLDINDNFVGIELAGDSIDGLTIENVDISNAINGIRKVAGADIDVTDFALYGGSISDSYIGINISAAESGGAFDGVVIDGTQFTNLTAKGIYAEQMSNALITNIQMNDVGEFGQADPFGNAVGSTGAGIDLNLKYDSYSNITIQNFDFEQVGTSNADNPLTAPDPIGGAITIKARDDGAYSATPATLTNVTVQNGSIDGTSTGVRIGEPGKLNEGPTGVTVENVSISNALSGEIDNRSEAVLSVTGTSGDDQIAANAAATGNFSVEGGSGADTLIGGAGADTFEGGAGDNLIDGGGGHDVAVYQGAFTVGSDGGSLIVTHAGGVDTLSGVEQIESDTGTSFYVGTGGFATIQDAIDAAQSGDTIHIAAGTYAESLTIAGKALTLEASGGAGTVTVAPTGAGSVALTVSGDVGSVALDGIAFDGGGGTGSIGILISGGADVDALTLTGVTVEGFSNYGILTNANTLHGVTIEGGTFDANGTGAAPGASHIHLWGFTGNASLTDVIITGAEGDGPTSATNPEFGLQFTGLVNSDLETGEAPPMGTVVLDGVEISGAFGKNALGIFNYSDLGGLSTVGDGVDLSSAVTGWGPVLNIDGIADDVDASALDIALPATGIPTEIQGDKIAQVVEPAGDRSQEITGTEANDRLIGKGGDDTLRGGNGNDEIFGHDKPGEPQTVDGGNDQLYGDGGADSLYGGNGDDRLDGGLGSDRLDGGEGTDTATFGAGAVLSFNGTNWVVQDGGDTDTLVDVERVQIDGSTYLLVDTVGQGFASIGDAIAAADPSGDVVLLADGTYTGVSELAVTKSITIEGIGSGAVIDGQLNELNDSYAGSTADWLETETSIVAAGAGLRINANDVTLRDLTIRDYSTAIELGGGNGIHLENVVLEDNLIGVRKGTAAVVTDFDMVGGAIRDGASGMIIYGATNAGEFSNVSIDGVDFDDLAFKGLYFEQLDAATITGATMDNVGEFGRGADSAYFQGALGGVGAGIDINLKYGAYADIVIENFTFNDVGSSDGAGTPDALGGAILVKARDDAPSYSANPATLDNVVIRDGTIDGTSTAVRIGEPDKANAGPTNVTVQNVAISNAATGALDNQTGSTLTVIGTVNGDALTTHADASGAFNVDGSNGPDTLEGGEGNDTLSGGVGSDTVIASGGNDTFEGGSGTDWVKVEAGSLAAPKAFLTVTDFTSGEGIDLSSLGTVSSGGAEGTLQQGQYAISTTEVGGSWHHVVEIGVDSLAGSDLQVTLIAGEELDATLGAGTLTFAPAVEQEPEYLDYAFWWAPRDVVALAQGTSTGFTNATLVASPGSGWELSGTGDFDGDGDDDLLWWNAALGGAAMGEVNDLSIASPSWVGSPGSGFTVAAILDVDGDGTDDVVWQSADGGTVLVADGAGIGTAAVTLGGDWQFGGIGNLSGGGNQIVWTSASLNGVVVTPVDTNSGATFFGVYPGSGWTLSKIDDLAGDGRDDLIWTSGGGANVAITSFSATAPAGITGAVGSPGSGWELADAGDFAGSMKGLLWHNDDLSAALVTQLGVDGGSGAIGIDETVWLGGPGAGWQFDRVLNADGIVGDEILWLNNALGGYSLQHDPLDFGSAAWIGNVLSTDALRVAYPVDLSPGPGWTLQGFGDFDGDGDDDLAWWNNGLAGAAWTEVEGSGTGAVAWVGAPGPGFTIDQIIDADGDGVDDLVWVSADRKSVLVSDGASIDGQAVSLGDDYTYAGLGDVDGEGVKLVWESEALVGVALSSRTSNVGAEWYPVHPGSGWEMLHVMDFLGDGNEDFLWWNESLNGIAFTSNPTGVTEWFGSPGIGWTLQGVGQLDGIGGLDLLWQNSADSAVAITTLELDTASGGIDREGETWVGSLGSAWSIDRLVDTDGDGIDEILWRNDDLSGFAIQHDPHDLGSLSWLGNLSPEQIAAIETWRLDEWRVQATGDFALDV